MIGLKENSQKTDRKGTGIMKENRYELNKQLAQMLKGGVIMDVTTPEQAKIAEEAGACAVMALERIPADIRAAGGVSRMSDPKMIRGIQEAVSIPVIAIGGITQENVSTLAGSGICGIEVISAIYAQPDIRKAAQDLKIATAEMVKA